LRRQGKKTVAKITRPLFRALSFCFLLLLLANASFVYPYKYWYTCPLCMENPLTQKGFRCACSFRNGQLEAGVLILGKVPWLRNIYCMCGYVSKVANLDAALLPPPPPPEVGWQAVRAFLPVNPPPRCEEWLSPHDHPG